MTDFTLLHLIICLFSGKKTNGKIPFLINRKFFETLSKFATCKMAEPAAIVVGYLKDNRLA